MSLGGASDNGQSYQEQYESIYDSLNSILQDYKDDAKNIYENRNGFQRVANNEIISELESFKEDIYDDINDNINTIDFIINADSKYFILSDTLQKNFISLRSNYLDLQPLVQRYINLKKQRLMAATRNARNAAIKKAKNNAKANKLKGRGIAERKTRRK